MHGCHDLPQHRTLKTLTKEIKTRMVAAGIAICHRKFKTGVRRSSYRRLRFLLLLLPDTLIYSKPEWCMYNGVKESLDALFSLSDPNHFQLYIPLWIRFAYIHLQIPIQNFKVWEENWTDVPKYIGIEINYKKNNSGTYIFIWFWSNFAVIVLQILIISTSILQDTVHLFLFNDLVNYNF